ncbi:HalOD1 output domain-containing protein [Haloarcula litorea]|uniref:HalOD1 output domain-containing protein n=1 Tax=Haloarcula litorea TaxID=3032579 RepID=UPI0023E7C806|nr:HalOD1 output domain-containing protein [Halomicroarcula sp. GDY20]
MEICHGGGEPDASADSSESVSTIVARELAATMGRRPTATTPLAESVDPDAMDELFAASDTELEIAFEHDGYLVRVSEDRVSVSPTE